MGHNGYRTGQTQSRTGQKIQLGLNFTNNQMSLLSLYLICKTTNISII